MWPSPPLGANLLPRRHRIPGERGGQGDDRSEKRKAESEKRKAKSGKRKAESGKRKAESGKRKAESGKRKAESGSLGFARDDNFRAVHDWERGNGGHGVEAAATPPHPPPPVTRTDATHP